MKRHLIAAAALTASLVTACGHGSANKVASNAQVKQDSAVAQQMIQACLTKGSFLTHAGRTAIVDCIAPRGHSAEFEACAQKQLSSAHLTTKAGREGYLQAVVTCGENNR